MGTVRRFPRLYISSPIMLTSAVCLRQALLWHWPRQQVSRNLKRQVAALSSDAEHKAGAGCIAIYNASRNARWQRRRWGGVGPLVFCGGSFARNLVPLALVLQAQFATQCVLPAPFSLLQGHSAPRPPRFYVPTPLAGLAAGAMLRLPADEARHAAKTLRLRPGDAVELCDGCGFTLVAELGAVDKSGALVMAAAAPVQVRAVHISRARRGARGARALHGRGACP